MMIRKLLLLPKYFGPTLTLLGYLAGILPLFPEVAAGAPQLSISDKDAKKQSRKLSKKHKKKTWKKHQKAMRKMQRNAKNKRRWKRTRRGQGQIKPPSLDSITVMQAKHYNTVAKDLFSQGKFAEAAVEYKRAYEISPHPEFLFNLGQCYQQLKTLKDLETALFYLKSYRKSSSEGANAKNVEAEIAAIKGQIKSILDEQEREQQRRETQKLSLITPSNLPPEAPSGPAVYKKWWFWGMVGALAAGTVAAIVVLQPGTIDPVNGTMDPGKIQMP